LKTETGTIALLIAITFDNTPVIIQAPETIRDILDSCHCEDHNFRGLPTENGVYSCTADYIIMSDEDEVEYKFNVTNAQKVEVPTCE